MTPVYDVAIVDWKTNSCGEYSNAARLNSSVVSTTNNHPTDTLSATSKLFIFFCYQHVRKCVSESLTKQQLEKNMFGPKRLADS